MFLPSSSAPTSRTTVVYELTKPIWENWDKDRRLLCRPPEHQHRGRQNLKCPLIPAFEKFYKEVGAPLDKNQG
jgi:TRAP-type uncharacterized transport system substrate-binding protein